jgi:Rrf2 family protein
MLTGARGIGYHQLGPKESDWTETVWLGPFVMLKLTKKADYGLIALKHLATVRGTRDSASAKEIADSYLIPLPLLSKVLQKLAKCGFLVSVQGTNGGYRLSRDAGRITVLEVIRSIDGPVLLTSCFTDHKGCDQSELCTVREPLRRVHESIQRLLDSISIADLVDEPVECDSAGSARDLIDPALILPALARN